MKHESNESDIIVYDLPDDYSVSVSSSSARPTEKKDKEKHIPIPQQEHNAVGAKTLFGGITGKVYDKLTYRRVEGATVSVVKNLSVRTDERGEFFITNIKPGTYKITVVEDGYMVQSRRGTVVPGETTKLESFHLVPSCLAADYPDEIFEEETTEEMSVDSMETVVEIPAESPSLEIHGAIVLTAEIAGRKIEKDEETKTTPVNLSEKGRKASFESSDPAIIVVEGVGGKIITGVKPHEGIAEEKLIELPDALIDKQILSALEEEVEKEAITHTIVASVEGIDNVSPDNNISIPDEAMKSPEIYEVSGEASVPLGEERGFAETTISGAAETTLEKMRTVDVTSQTSDQTTIVEATKPENASQDITAKETEPRLPWMAWLRRKLKGKSIVNESPEKSLEATLESRVAITQVTEGEESPEEYRGATEKIEPFTHEAAGEESQEETLVTNDISHKDETIPTADEEIQTFMPDLTFPKPTIPSPVSDYFIDSSLTMSPEIVLGDIPSVHELALMFDQNRVSEIMQVEGVPQEISIHEMAVIEKIEHGMITDKIFQDEPPGLPTGAILGFSPQKLFIETARENELFAGISLTDKISIINEEIQLPIITRYSEKTAIALPEENDSTETTISKTKEAASEELSSDDMIFHISDETGTVEMTHLEEVERVFSKQETQSRLPWKRWVKNKVKRKFSKQDFLISSKEDIEEAIALKGTEGIRLPEKELPESFIEVTNETIYQNTISDGTCQKELSPDVSIEEIIDYREMHKTITELNKQRETAAIKTDVEDKEEDGVTVIEERTADISEVYLFSDGSALPKVLLEGLSDDEIASISEEEKAAMLSEQNSIEMAGLVGIVNAQPNPSYKGLPISVAYTLKNTACENPEGFVMQITVANSDTGAIIETFETQINCRKGTFSIGGFVIFTTSYETGVYRLNMQLVSEKTKTSHLLANIPLEIKPISFNL